MTTATLLNGHLFNGGLTHIHRHTIQAHVLPNCMDFGSKVGILCINLYNNQVE